MTIIKLVKSKIFISIQSYTASSVSSMDEVGRKRIFEWVQCDRAKQ